MKPLPWDDIRQSLYNLFDHRLLENGAYTNIISGQQNIRKVDQSKLFPVVDRELYDVSGYIWQSAFHNWVYESGIVNLPTPTVCSGVYINGVFRAKGDGLHIDYKNGRVIFDTFVDPSSSVQAAFSYKEYSFVTPDNNKTHKSNTKFEDNSPVYRDSFPASPDVIYLPAIFIEIEDASEKGFQFGGTTESLPIFRFPIISNNSVQVEGIGCLLTKESTKTMPVTPALSAPKFDFYNDLTEGYSFCSCSGQTQNFAYLKSVKYSRFYETKSETVDPTLFGGFITVEISAIR